MTRRYLYHYLRKPSLLGIALVQPVLFVLLWTYVFSGAIQTPGGITYVDYLMPGLFILAIAFGSANTGVGLADDLARGLTDPFRALPMARPPCWSAGPWPIPPATPSSCC
jgi:ABC-2 type transport system permease protein